MDKRLLKLISFLLALALIWFAPLLNELGWIRSDLYPVKQVLDGDTIEVNMAGRLESVRFIGIDTPETHHPDKGAQCYGQEASDNLRQIIGEKVRLVADFESTNRDKYDRLLRYVYNEDGLLLNLEQVKRGYAFAMTSFDHSLMPIFESAELLAESRGLGLWSECEINYNNGYLQTQTVPN